MKDLGKNIRENLWVLGLGKDFLDMLSKLWEKTINKLDHIKIKSFSTSKDTTEKTKREATDLEKRFANGISGK